MIDGGVSAIARPFTRTSYEYYYDIDKIESVSSYLKNYASLIPSLTDHSKVHPPGPCLFLWLVSKIFGKGLFISAFSVIILSSLSLLPIYFLAKQLYGKKVAILSLALFSLSPSVVMFTATSMNAVFTLFASLSVIFFFKSYNDRHRYVFALLTGGSFAMTVFMAYEEGILALFFFIIAIYVIETKAIKLNDILNLIVMLTTFLCFFLFLYIITKFNPIESFLASYKQAQYDILEKYAIPGSRFYWFFGQLIVFFTFVGLSTATLYFEEVYLSIRKALKRLGIDIYIIAFVITLIVLDFAVVGHKGENERNWMFLVPFIVIPVANNLCNKSVRFNSNILIYLSLVLLFLQTFVSEILLDTYW
jgi:4-amino-4-deoxy-L-arabinose transferase-like glycosyltransferase